MKATFYDEMTELDVNDIENGRYAKIDYQDGSGFKLTVLVKDDSGVHEVAGHSFEHLLVKVIEDAFHSKVDEVFVDQAYRTVVLMGLENSKHGEKITVAEKPRVGWPKQ